MTNHQTTKKAMRLESGKLLDCDAARCSPAVCGSARVRFKHSKNPVESQLTKPYQKRQEWPVSSWSYKH
jgi:hypothetical protein